jgi:glucosamine kinase
MSFFLGIDAGGTTTRAAIADEEQVLARAQSGSIKTMRVPPAQAEVNLRTLLSELEAASGVPVRHVTSTCIGIAGSTVSSVNGWVWRTLGPMLGGDLHVCGDADIALDGAFPGEGGVLVIAGTGSNTLGRTTKGDLVTVGGWGPMLADEGSGHWIGHQAMRAALRAHDEQDAPVKLLNALAAQWKADTLEQLVETAHAMPAADFAALTPTVVEVAEQGDALALNILRQAGRDLGRDASVALRKLLALDADAPRRVAFIGGVLENIAPVRKSMVQTIKRAHRGVSITPQAVDALEGALWRARQHAQAAP